MFVCSLVCTATTLLLTHVFLPWQSLLAAVFVGVATTVVELYESHGMDTLFCPVTAVAILGMFGVHKFYMGKTRAAIITLLVTILGAVTIVAPATMLFIGIIEGVTYLKMDDDAFKATYLDGKKEWF